MEVFRSRGQQSGLKLAYHGSTSALMTHLLNRHKNVALQEQKNKNKKQMEKQRKMAAFTVSLHCSGQ